MKRNRLLIACIVWACSPGLLTAGSAGREPFNFLFLDANARAVGMGGAYTALATDANALLYNPAGLGVVTAHEATFMENRYVQDVNQEYLGLATKWGLGLNANHLSFGDIPRTTISNPDGSGSYGIRDLALGAGYGRSIQKDLSLGAGAKYIRETIDDVSASAYAVDLGALYSAPFAKGLRFGLAVQNIGPTVKFHRAKENLPLNVRLGGAYTFRLLRSRGTVSLDMTRERSEDMLFALGGEMLLTDRLAFRGGFNTRNDAGTGVTMGFGWRHRRLGLDYAFVPMGDLGSSHRLSLSVRWGDDELADVLDEVADTESREKSRVFETPKTPDELMKSAEKSIARGELFRAKELIQKASMLLTQDNPRLVRVYERLGRVFYLEKDPFAKTMYVGAVKHAVRLGVKDASAADAYAGVGLCLLRENNTDYARKFLDKALEMGPTDEIHSLVENGLKELDRTSQIQ